MDDVACSWQRTSNAGLACHSTFRNNACRGGALTLIDGYGGRTASWAAYPRAGKESLRDDVTVGVDGECVGRVCVHVIGAHHPALRQALRSGMHAQNDARERNRGSSVAQRLERAVRPRLLVVHIKQLMDPKSS
jgi:hypothetical protein